ATDDWWSAAVTRRRTTWSAGVGNTAPAVGPPGWNAPKGPLSETSHAYPTIGLLRSEDVDTSENLSATPGVEGNQRKDADGAALSLYVAAGAFSSARKGGAGISPSVPVRTARPATPSDAVLDVRARTALLITSTRRLPAETLPAFQWHRATTGLGPTPPGPHPRRVAARRPITHPPAATRALRHKRLP